jgi:DNA-directed RNA polymerase specialized sigma24 family protein
MSKRKKAKKPKKFNDKISEEQFIETLDIITKKLVYKFKFGYHDIEDMKQQAAIFAIEGLEKYDHSRPLENFLWTHVRNRLFNYKRDNYQRPDKPCITCPLYQPNNEVSDCAEFKDKLNCASYKSWFHRNNSKKSIMQPIYIENKDPENKQNFIDHLSNQELIDKIEQILPIKYRETFLKIKYGNKVLKNEKVKLQNYLKKRFRNYKNNE